MTKTNMDKQTKNILKEFDKKFSGIYTYDAIGGCGDLNCCDTSACVDEEIKAFLKQELSQALADQQAGFREIVGGNHHYGGGDEGSELYWKGYNEAKREIKDQLTKLDKGE